MRTSIARWTVLLVGALVAGPMLATLFDRLSVAGDGGPASSVLLSVSPMRSGMAVLAAYGVALALGCAGAKACGPRTGWAAAAFALMGPAWAGGSMIDLLRWSDAPGAFYRLAGEALVLGALTVVLAGVVARVGRSAERDGSDPLASTASATGLIVGLVAGAVGAWLLTQDTTKGQCLAGAVIGGVFAAGAGRIAAARAPAMVFMVVVALLGVAGPVLGAAMHGGEALRAVYEFRVVHLALPTPLDWAAGALLGVPLGLNLAGSVMERRQTAGTPAAS